MSLAKLWGHEEYPKFELGKPRFAQGTFVGRWLHFVDVIDPRTLFTSGKQLEQSIQLLNEYKNGTLRGNITDAELWRAQRIKQATIHPDTGEKIFAPFRMSGFVPFGFPFVVGLLLPNPSMFSIVIWQWANQSHNAFVNYANRNATKENKLSRFVASYMGAVGTAVGISTGLTFLNRRATRFGPTTKMILQRVIPLPAVAAASSCNAFLMRFHELREGINVCDKDGNVLGTSKVAAKRAVRDTVLTRATLVTIVLLLPALIMPVIERQRPFRNSARMRLVGQSAVCIASFAFALPIALALFTQQATMRTSDAEPEIQAKTTESEVFYNKGL